MNAVTLTHFLKTQTTFVEEQLATRIQHRQLAPILLHVRHRLHRSGVRHFPVCIRVILEIAAGRDQVGITIEVRVEKDRAPCPLARHQSGIRRNLRKCVITTVQKKSVLRILRLRSKAVDFRRTQFQQRPLSHAPRVIATQHVTHEKIQRAVQIHIRKIHRHRTGTHVPHRCRRRECEIPATIVEPQTIRRLKIVADIKIGRAIAVDVAELRRQPRSIQRPRRQ